MVDHFKTGLDLVNFTEVNEILASVRDAMGKYGFDILNASRRWLHPKKNRNGRGEKRSVVFFVDWFNF